MNIPGLFPCSVLFFYMTTFWIKIQIEASHQTKKIYSRYYFDVFFSMQYIINHFVENHLLERDQIYNIFRETSKGVINYVYMYYQADCWQQR